MENHPIKTIEKPPFLMGKSMEYYGFRCRFAPINWMFNVNPVVNGGSDLELGIFIFPMYIYIYSYIPYSMGSQLELLIVSQPS